MASASREPIVFQGAEAEQPVEPSILDQERERHRLRQVARDVGRQTAPSPA